MPANLPPEYLAAEERFRRAKSPQEKVTALQEMLSVIPKHKGTDKLRAQLRSKLSKLREESQKRRAAGRGFYLFNVKKEGAGQIVLVGLPNVGKSTLLSRLTNAYTEVADYPYTTRIPIVGMMDFENIQIQLVDAPAVTLELGEAWFTNLARNADGLVLMVDLGDDPLVQIKVLLEKLEEVGVSPVDGEGGSAPQEKRMVIVCNKADLPESRRHEEAVLEAFGGRFPILSISAKTAMGLDPLKKRLFQLLHIIRIYSKIPGKEVDYSAPFVLPEGSTVEEMARLVHKDLFKRLKFARIWGSGKFSGQRVKRGFVLTDGDVVELHT
ncbi:MAG: 50S ribosome-binding GTPase [Deltaproteobacteria bacterium]|nr:50S ribosome-binding GTPase [Deltaproteobacteria bacterium]